MSPDRDPRSKPAGDSRQKCLRHTQPAQPTSPNCPAAHAGSFSRRTHRGDSNMKKIILLAAILFAPACADEKPINPGTDCPCGDGFKCCPGNQCLPDDQMCGV